MSLTIFLPASLHYQGVSHFKNNSGPKTVPCDTPLFILTGSDVLPPQTTLWVHPDRNEDIHCKTEFLMP